MNETKQEIYLLTSPRDVGNSSFGRLRSFSVASDRRPEVPCLDAVLGRLFKIWEYIYSRHSHIRTNFSPSIVQFGSIVHWQSTGFRYQNHEFGDKHMPCVLSFITSVAIILALHFIPKNKILLSKFNWFSSQIGPSSVKFLSLFGLIYFNFLD